MSMPDAPSPAGEKVNDGLAQLAELLRLIYAPDPAPDFELLVLQIDDAGTPSSAEQAEEPNA
jgi:hypothetical protein